MNDERLSRTEEEVDAEIFREMIPLGVLFGRWSELGHLAGKLQAEVSGEQNGSAHMVAPCGCNATVDVDDQCPAENITEIIEFNPCCSAHAELGRQHLPSYAHIRDLQ